MGDGVYRPQSLQARSGPIGRQQAALGGFYCSNTTKESIWLRRVAHCSRRADRPTTQSRFTGPDSLLHRNLGREFGDELLARLDGWPVALVASDPAIYGGAWTAESAQKLTRFLDLAHTFHLPVVHLVDIPGFMIGPDAEKAGTIRHGARALAAVYQAQLPWCSVLLRKVFGVAGAAHMNHTRLHYRYAWPSGDWGSLPIEGGIEAAYRADLAASEDPAKLRAEIEERLNRVRSPFRTAEAFMVEEIIDPRDTRKLLCEFANLAAPLRRAGPIAAPMRP